MVEELRQLGSFFVVTERIIRLEGCKASLEKDIRRQIYPQIDYAFLH